MSGFDAEEYRAKANRKKQESRKLWIMLGVVLAAIGTCSVVASISPESDGSNEMMAYRMAERFVRAELKAPSSAKFPRTMERADHVRFLGRDTYEINSWVDAQNSFGAEVRTEFRAVVRENPDSWTLESLEMD